MHGLLASFILVTLGRPYQNESGLQTYEHTAAMILWFRIGSFINNVDDARLYVPCLNKIRSLLWDEDETKFSDWWTTFWYTVGMKIPDAATDYVEDFLNDVLDRQQSTMAYILPVSYNFSFYTDEEKNIEVAKK